MEVPSFIKKFTVSAAMLSSLFGGQLAAADKKHPTGANQDGIVDISSFHKIGTASLAPLKAKGFSINGQQVRTHRIDERKIANAIVDAAAEACESKDMVFTGTARIKVVDHQQDEIVAIPCLLAKLQKATRSK